MRTQLPRIITHNVSPHMWKLIRPGLLRAKPTFARKFTSPASFSRVTATIAATSLFLGGSLILNDASNSSLAGVSVDSSIDAFPLELNNKDIISSKYELVASGVRSVTFVGFKVYGAGIYVQADDHKKLTTILDEYSKLNKGRTVEQLLNDKELSQEIIDDISQKISYAIKITPVRNTDYGHLRDGLTKSLLACPLTKTMREEVGNGVEQLRNIFQGFKGSVPKNDTLWLVAEKDTVTVLHEGTKAKKVEKMGTITEPTMKRVLLVLYLSCVKPLSKPLQENFVSHVSTEP